jgi:hypothetical protein
MDVILDSNVHFEDLKMRRNQFQELFAYLRRTGSRLVIPMAVFVEVAESYRRELTKEVDEARSAWNRMAKRSIADPGHVSWPRVSAEVRALKDKLRKPSAGVQTLLYGDIRNVDVGEVVRRGAKRIRPANRDGEELRDVIIWMIVLQYAKRVGTAVAFVSRDLGYTDDEKRGLHPQLLTDVKEAGVEVSFFREVGAFVALNALEHESVDENQLFGLVTKDVIEKEATKELHKIGSGRGVVKESNVESLHLSTAQKYRVGDSDYYMEAAFAGVGHVVVRETSFVNVLESPAFGAPNFMMRDSPSPAADVFLQPFASAVRPWIAGFAQPLQPHNYVPFSQGIPKIERTSAERAYRCEFQLQLSIRLADGNIVSAQTDSFNVNALVLVTAASDPNQAGIRQ